MIIMSVLITLDVISKLHDFKERMCIDIDKSSSEYRLILDETNDFETILMIYIKGGNNKANQSYWFTFYCDRINPNIKIECTNHLGNKKQLSIPKNVIDVFCDEYDYSMDEIEFTLKYGRGFTDKELFESVDGFSKSDLEKSLEYFAKMFAIK